MTDACAGLRPHTRLAARLRDLPDNVRGALWMVLAGACFALQGAMVKAVGERLDVLQVQFFRCLFGFLTVLPFVMGPMLQGRIGEVLRTRRPVLHVARALVGISGMFCGFYAVTHLPLADAIAISFTRPLFVIVLAVLFLGEVVGWRRWAATAVGFVGVLIIVRPGTTAFDWAAVVALLGAFLVADVGIMVKKLSTTERNVTVLFYFTTITTLVSAVPAYLVWIAPTPVEFALMVLVGISATAGQALALRAYRIGEASAVTPFDSTRMLFAVAYGLLLFGEVPDLWTLAGATILIGSTIYIAHREYRLGRATASGGAGG